VELSSGRELQARPGGHANAHSRWTSNAGSLPQSHTWPLLVGVHVPLCLHGLGRQLAETSIDSGHFEASEGCQP